MVTTRHKEEYIEKLRNNQGDNYTMLGEYQGAKIKTLFRHNICGFEWETTPQNILRLSKCPRCANNVQLTTREFREEVYELVGDEYTVLGAYTKAKEKIDILHNTCGNINKQTPDDFKRGKRCGHCAGKHNDTYTFVAKMYELVKDEYVVLGKYTGAKNPVLIRHELCGSTYPIAPIEFYRGSRCWRCWVASQKKTTEWFIEQVADKAGVEYTVLGEYIKSKDHILMRHEICGREWKVTPDNFLRKESRCPSCLFSKGELLVECVLDRIGVSYVREKSFENCRNHRPLPFDFYLPSMNICIEYDGEHHYRPVNYGGIDDSRAQQAYRDTITRDEIKNRYCHDLGIGLLRIPYYLNDIQVGEVITDFLSNREVTQEGSHQIVSS